MRNAVFVPLIRGEERRKKIKIKEKRSTKRSFLYNNFLSRHEKSGFSFFFFFCFFFFCSFFFPCFLFFFFSPPIFSFSPILPLPLFLSNFFLFSSLFSGGRKNKPKQTQHLHTHTHTHIKIQISQRPHYYNLFP